MTFAKNRARLLEHDVTGLFFRAVVSEARRQNLIAEGHCNVGGALLEALAFLRSVRPRDEDGGNAWKDFRGERRSNVPHASMADLEAMLARKGNGHAARLHSAGHALTENRNGLVVDVVLGETTGTAEQEAALAMLERVPTARRVTAAGTRAATRGGSCPHLLHSRRCASRGHETAAFGGGWEGGPAACGLRGEPEGGKRVEEVFGWLNTVGVGRKLRS